MTNAERAVAELLKDLGIKWAYEQPVFIWDENNRPRVWTPDFYLKQFGIYLEVCGSEQFDYEYRRKIFNSNGYRVIFLHFYKRRYYWEKHLLKYLNLFVMYRNNKLNQIIKIKD